MKKVETILTKNHKQENFPVGSWLLSKNLRPQILIFYKFARAADDIADSPNLSSKEKIKRLNFFKEGIKNNNIKISKTENLKKVCKKIKLVLHMLYIY